MSGMVANADELLQQLHMLGINADESLAMELYQKCGSIEESLEYYSRHKEEVENDIDTKKVKRSSGSLDFSQDPIVLRARTPSPLTVAAPLPLSCEGYAKWLTSRKIVDEYFNQFLKENKVFPCPSCKNSYNYSNDPGSRYYHCKCNQNFCGVCGILLKDSQRLSHFKIGPTGVECVGIVDEMK